MNHLRRLAVFVDEVEHGHFHWVLHESKEDASIWGDVQASEHSYATWVAAYDSGTVELMKLVDDERVGPRAPGEDEDAAPVG
ncbi:hypothetical protein [Polaromonas sp.]|uniref:hypothetical protein n=1 Tax=Polaromonas sp. TaxID=1869339 RepID=UPI00352B81B2